MNALLLQSRKTANDRWCKTTSDANTVLDTEGAKLSIEPLGGQLVTTDAPVNLLRILQEIQLFGAEESVAANPGRWAEAENSTTAQAG
jgi:hypothetical protein